MLTSCAPTINKISGLILDGQKIGQESLIEDALLHQIFFEDELALISI